MSNSKRTFTIADACTAGNILLGVSAINDYSAYIGCKLLFIHPHACYQSFRKSLQGVVVVLYNEELDFVYYGVRLVPVKDLEALTAACESVFGKDFVCVLTEKQDATTRCVINKISEKLGRVHGHVECTCVVAEHYASEDTRWLSEVKRLQESLDSTDELSKCMLQMAEQEWNRCRDLLDNGRECIKRTNPFLNEEKVNKTELLRLAGVITEPASKALTAGEEFYEIEEEVRKEVLLRDAHNAAAKEEVRKEVLLKRMLRIDVARRRNIK